MSKKKLLWGIEKLFSSLCTCFLRIYVVQHGWVYCIFKIGINIYNIFDIFNVNYLSIWTIRKSYETKLGYWIRFGFMNTDILRVKGTFLQHGLAVPASRIGEIRRNKGR